MRTPVPGRAAAATAAALLAVLAAGCGSGRDAPGAAPGGTKAARAESPSAPARHLPGVGERMRERIPAASRQVVAVYGERATSAASTVVLYRERGGNWVRERSWPAHNGRKGWTAEHREGDRRSPVGVFGLTDAGGVLPDPGSALPYTSSPAFTPPAWWSPRTRHDFDHVIAIDYNRVPGTSPLDPARPLGRERGGGIWLHVDHGSGTSGCVSVAAPAMDYLLRTLDPKLRPVVVMGDRASLAR
ncbi:lipoprotein [Streptomyces capparidis]